MAIRAVVLGAAGFIGHHLCRRLRREGYFVRAVDIRRPEWPTPADEWKLLDLREERDAIEALVRYPGGFDEVYQLAADMGGMGWIDTHEIECLDGNARINRNCLSAAARCGARRYFFASSACVYRNMRRGEEALEEDEAYPALPDNEYGWEKLYAERLALAWHRAGRLDVRIGRFANCYGPECRWRGGREKAPAALCRKAALAADGGEIEVWGDGSAVRNYIHVDDLLDGVRTLMRQEKVRVANIGTDEYVTVDFLATLAITASGKRLSIRHVEGPVGVAARRFSHERMHDLGWQPRIPLVVGIRRLYEWVANEVRTPR